MAIVFAGILQVSETILRLGVRAAASVLLISSGVHATAHYRAYVNVDAFDASHRALMTTLQAYEILPRWHVNAWTMLCGYSVCFAILLMFSGATLWWMGRELPAARLRPLAIASAVLLFVGVAVLGLLDPIPMQMSILAIAGLALGLGGMLGRARVEV
jgi:hypothetical protein